MNSETGRPVALLSLLLFGFVFLASIEPIRNYDYFWHLATGRWMVENGRVVERDPFGVASDAERWVDYSWLFQLGLYAGYGLAGHAGMSFLRALAVAALVVLIFVLSSRRTAWPAALLLAAIAWYGADHRLTLRPETVATFLLVGTVWLVLPPFSWRKVLGYVVLTTVWVNVHPSALVSPLVAGISVLFSIEYRGELWRRVALCLASSMALLINPYGVWGVLAPLRLMRLIGEKQFVNLEWLPSRPGAFPVLYVLIAFGLTLFATGRKRWGDVGSMALFAFFAFLAVRHLRNQGLFFATAPILLAPMVGEQFGIRLRTLAVGGAGLIGVVLLAGRFPIRTGVDETIFPVRAVGKLEAADLPGNIYNPDQFGGYLIWTFYPERRVLTDGRNDQYLSFLREYDVARRDSRAWSSLLAKYRITIAVEEYRRGFIEVIDSETGTRRRVAPSLVYFPRRQWALIAFDDVAMVLVRRDAVPEAQLRSLEYRFLFPETGSVSGPAAGVAQELARAFREAGANSSRVQQLLAAHRRMRRNEIGSSGTEPKFPN